MTCPKDRRWPNGIIDDVPSQFQSMKDYEDVKDDVESLKRENVRECYSEISKTSEQIQHTRQGSVSYESKLETVQKDFQASITTKQFKKSNGLHKDNK